MVHIVGAGLAGSILKRVLDKNGIPSLIYDCEKPWRASVISENLFSLSWKKALGDSVVANGVKTLESVVDIQSIHFKTKAGYNDTLYVPVKDVLTQYQRKEINVNGLVLERGKDVVVVDCRGYWASVLSSQKMVGLTGQGIMLAGRLDRIPPQMNFVAPYIHQKLMQVNEGKMPMMWYGDSTCIEYSQYMERQSYYVQRCTARARTLMQSIGLSPNRTATIEYGIRPWVKPNKGYLEFNGKLIVNTGGWKCGLIIYADHAQKILKYLKQKRYV